MDVYRKGGKLVLEVSEDALVAGAEHIPGNELKVVDKERYLNFIASHLTDFGDNGDFNSASHLTRLFDRLAIEAAETDQGALPANAPGEPGRTND